MSFIFENMKNIPEDSEKYRTSDGHFYIVYKITNILNNMQYIGVHKTKKLNDEYYGSSKYLNSAIKKYSIENFNFEILHFCQNKTKSLYLEETLVNKEWVDRLDTYNIMTGGNNSYTEYIRTKEIKQKIAKAHVGFKHTVETKLKISKATSGKNNPYYGKKHTVEIRKKMSDKVMATRKYGKEHFAAYPLRIVNTITNEDIIIGSLQEYCRNSGLRWGGLYKSYINKRLIYKGKTKSTGIIVLEATDKISIIDIIEKYSNYKILLNNKKYYISDILKFAKDNNIPVSFLYRALYENIQINYNTNIIEVYKNNKLS